MYVHLGITGKRWSSPFRNKTTDPEPGPMNIIYTFSYSALYKYILYIDFSHIAAFDEQRKVTRRLRKILNSCAPLVFTDEEIQVSSIKRNC